MWTTALFDLHHVGGAGLLLSRRWETSRPLLFTSAQYVYDFTVGVRHLHPKNAAESIVTESREKHARMLAKQLLR